MWVLNRDSERNRELRKRVEELEGAIRKHMRDVWGVGEKAEHPADAELYSILQDETVGRLPYAPDEPEYDHGPAKEDR